MTVLFVDLVSLDGSRPEGTLKFTLERVVLGAPDTVPSSIEVPIKDGKARVENLLPGRMRVRVNTSCWGKEWELVVPDSGEHDVLELLGEQAPEFEHALWASLLGRVEALEQKPDPDLSGYALKTELPAPVDLTPLEGRVSALESKPEVDLSDYVPRAEYDALVKRVEALEPPAHIVIGPDEDARAAIDSALEKHGLKRDAVTELPFTIDTSQATSLNRMFSECSSLTCVPDLDTSNVTKMTALFENCKSLTRVPDLDTSKATDLSYMFIGCSSLTDGNVRLIGKNPAVNTDGMTMGSGLSRNPFYDPDGTPIN